MKKILFMCVANSARSQMAEGIAKHLYPKIEVQSAGSIPAQINPLAIQAMKEINIDISNHYAKDFESLENKFINDLDYLITLCKEEVCPIINSDAIIFSWPFDDPASSKFSENQLEKFRETRDLLLSKIESMTKIFEQKEI